ncbi:MAG: alpha/beta hydrolase, partial [Acidimicrobiia bacterium]|nr:alpha/beta hydrolase [Acidimicrobiia bacterium]
MQPRILTYDLAGAGDPLVLLPGGLTGWLSWIPLQGPLSAHHFVVRVQTIHNELGSEGVVGDVHYNSFTERESLRLTLDELQISTADFAGWSRGGGALLDFALAYPSKVRTLTLIEPAAEWVLDESGRGATLTDPETRVAMKKLAGREVSEDDLADLLVFAGLAGDAATVRSDPSWDQWVAHRMALSWPYEDVDPARRDLANLADVSCPVL